MYSSYSSSPFEEFVNNGGLAITGAILTALVAIFVIALVIGAIVYILSAYPLYKLAKKLNRPYAWLAWIPIFSLYCRTYVLCDLAGDKELVIIPDKLVIKDRKMSFWIFVGISVLGGAIVGTISAFLSLIPIIGILLTIVLAFVPMTCLGFMEYAYLRDVLDIFKENKQSNKTTSIIVTVLDKLVSSGIARIIVLFTLLKLEPVAQNVVNCEPNPVYTPPVPEAPAYTEPTYTAPADTTNTAPVEPTVTNTDNNV